VKSTCRLTAIVVSALAFIACGGQTASSPSPSPTVNTATLAQLEAKPLTLPVVAPGDTCPNTAMSLIDYGSGSTATYGSGPVYGVGGPQTTTTWGDYFDVTYVTDPQFTGIALIRIRDLKSTRVGGFVGPYASGNVVGTDAIDGKAVQLHANLVLDAGHHPATSGNSKWGIWRVRQGVAAGWSGCFGIQVDGAGFTQVITGGI
jgi:hypothetical protein